MEKRNPIIIISSIIFVIGVIIFYSFFNLSDEKFPNHEIILKNSSISYQNFKLTFIQVSDESKKAFINYLDEVEKDWFYGIKEIKFYEDYNTFYNLGGCPQFSTVGGGCTKDNYMGGEWINTGIINLYINSSHISNKEFSQEIICHELSHIYIDSNLPEDVEEEIALDIGESLACIKSVV